VTTVLGLDIGGTRTRARLVTDGVVVAESASGSASLAAAGRERAAEVLEELLSKLPNSAELALDAICVGSAGTGADEADAYLLERLRPLTATGTVVVVNDAHLVLAAEQLEDGVAVIAGTGSIALGHFAGREQRAGGWGYLLGDEGSGYWIVREALRELARRHDTGTALGALGSALLDATGRRDVAALMQRFYDRPRPENWASVAELVLEVHDPASDSILRSAADHVARLALEVLRRLDGPDTLPIILAGGLLVGSRELSSLTRSAIERSVPHAQVRVASQPPVAGAVNLALAAAIE